jgi:hypothetical protein
MANKKINQLVSKTAILSTDIFGIGDATTGQLFKKTIAELQAAIGGAVISVNGLVGTVVLDTDDIQELATPTNKYFTDARARGAISLTVTGNSGASTYSSGTGVLNVPTYTLAGLGGISATFLSGTSGISYNSTTGVISYSGTVYTDASIRALFSGGTGITYNSSTGAISYSGTVYTDSSVRALISITTTGTSGASTYNNTTGVINVPNYTLAGLGGISLTSLSGGTGITYNNTTGAISYSGTVYTDASVRALISASGAVSYNNTTGVISLTSGNLTEATSSVLTITGGTGAVLGSGTSIQVKQASSSVSGFLSSTDWNTFNGKASALSGTTNYVAKFTSSSGIGNSKLYENSFGGIQINNTDTNGAQYYTTRFGPRGNNDGVSSIWFIPSNASPTIGWGTSATSTAYSISTLADDITRFSIASTGAATFSSSVQTGSTSGGEVLKTANSGINSVYHTFTNTAGTYYLGPEASTGGNLVTGDVGYEFVVRGPSGIVLSGNNGASPNVRITSAGLVGIGASISPTYLLEVSTAGGSQRIRVGTLQNNSNNATFEAITTASNTTASAAFFRANAGGSASIGVTTYNKTGGDSGNFANLSSQANTISIQLTGGGNVLVGTETDNGERLYVSGAIRATSTITANSDIRIKSNIAKIENALEKVGQISGYTYNTNYDDKRHGGVIAQEIDKVFPEIVNTGNDGLMGVEYGNISALLIEAIKEQNIKIKNLETLLASK